MSVGMFSQQLVIHHIVITDLHIFGNTLFYITFTTTSELCNKLVQVM